MTKVRLYALGTSTTLESNKSVQQNIEQQKILRGGNHADAFLIAKAFVTQGTVVTMEGLRPHAVKIPNICQHFEVPCMSLQDFMVQERWVF